MIGLNALSIVNTTNKFLILYVIVLLVSKWFFDLNALSSINNIKVVLILPN